MSVIDPRCAKWVTVDECTAVPRWALKACVYQDESEAGGRHNVYINVQDEHGAPLSGVKVWQKWPTAEPQEAQQLTLGGVTDFGLYGGPFYPDRNEVGAYSVYVEDPVRSDVVRGMGLPANRHVNYILTFQRVTTAEPPVTPPAGTVDLARVIRALELALADLKKPD